MPIAKTMPSPSSAQQWMPVVRGDAYQLSLKNGTFTFCDESGSQQIDLSIGQQSPYSDSCDKNHERIQSSCNNYVQLSGPAEGGNDDLAVGDNDYVLQGHMHACDQQGKVVIVTTLGAVEMIDGPTNKVAVVDTKGGERAVIGSDWIAWQSYDRKQSQLRLQPVAKAMEHATTPK